MGQKMSTVVVGGSGKGDQSMLVVVVGRWPYCHVVTIVAGRGNTEEKEVWGQTKIEDRHTKCSTMSPRIERRGLKRKRTYVMLIRLSGGDVCWCLVL